MRFYKKVLLFILILLFIRSVVHDLSVGTFSNQTTEEEKSTTESNIPPANEKAVDIDNNHRSEPYPSVPYTVIAGDTVLSIAEKLNEGDVPIPKLLTDFEKLNPGENPHQINIGETYYFPIYDKE